MKYGPIVIFLSFLIIGCSSDVDVSLSKYLPRSARGSENSDVFARVGDRTLTKGDVLVNISLLKKLSEHRADKPLEDSRIKSMANNVLANAIDHFVKVELIASITRTNGLEVSSEALERQEDRFYRSFRRPDETTDAVRSILNKAERSLVRRMSFAQVEFEAYVARNCSNDLQVSEAEIDAAMKRIVDWNEMVAKTNAYAYSMASNIVKWVEEGRDFAELADKYSQDPDKKPGGLIDDHAAVSFFNGRASYLEMLDQMPAGKVSDILPSVEGLLIVKALGKDPKTEMPLYQRIVLQTGEAYPKMTRKDLRQIGENELTDALHKRLTALAAANVKVEYPHGKDFLKPANSGGGLLK